MICRLLFFLILMMPALSLGQGITLEHVREVNREALKLNREGEFERAESILEELLSELDEDDSEIKYKAVTWQTLAKVAMNLGNYPRSFELARRSLDFGLANGDSLNMADNYNTIGINHYFLSDYDSTTYYYEKSLEIKRRIDNDPYSLAVSEYNLGIVYEDLGIPDKALELYLAAEKNLLKTESRETFLSDVYVGITHIHFYGGEMEKAEFYAEKALEEGLRTYGEDNPNITFIYTSYANILEYQERYGESIEILEKSLDIRRKKYGEDHRWTCESYYDLANVYSLAGQPEKAEELYRRAIAIGEKTKSRQYLAYAKTYLAGLYLDQGKDLGEAEQLLKSSLKEQREIFGERNEVVSENYTRLARLERIRKNDEAFFDYVNKSLNSSGYVRDSLGQVIAPYHALETLMLLGQWHLDKYEEADEEAHLLSSFALLDEQVELISHIQKNFSTDRSKINLVKEYSEVYESGMNLCWELFERTRDPGYLEKAFDLSEANRNTTLLGGLQEIRNKLLSDLPEDLIDFEKGVKSELEKVKMDLYYEKSAQNPDKELLAELMNRRIRLSYSIDSLYETFSRDFPKYRDLKKQDRDVDIPDLQLRLSGEDQLLSYFLGEDMIYSIALTKDTVRFLRNDNAVEVREKTDEFRNRLTERKEVLGVAQDLFGHLAREQLDPSRKNIIVVPDNVLSYVPFEILTDEEERHLIEDYFISYTGSAGIFLELKNEFFDYGYEENWAGFAPVYENDLGLPSNEDEVRRIAERCKGDSFLGEEASRQNFLGSIQKYGVLHLAMHATIDNINPKYNKLLFSDGELSSAEIYLSEMRARLAVLSACNTGFGKLEAGEGGMSMARAFHFSGVPSVVMSLWKVPDRETKIIMLHFYDHLKKGESLDEALRRAKLDYLDETPDPALRHPYYWAGFVINGNTEGLDFAADKTHLMLGLSTALLLLIGILVVAARRKRRTTSLQ